MGGARVLGIETSCDETAAALVEGGRILSNVVSSQVALHEKYRGIVPELASRAHLQKISGVLEAALAGSGAKGLDCVAYTRGPGLMGPLLVGKVAAQTLAWLRGCPLLGINHLEGHIFAAELSSRLHFPLIALIMALIAVPFAFSVGQRGALAGVAVSIGIAIVYRTVAELFEKMGNISELPAAAAAWSPDLLFGLAGIYLVLKVRT